MLATRNRHITTTIYVGLAALRVASANCSELKLLKTELPPLHLDEHTTAHVLTQAGPQCN